MTESRESAVYALDEMPGLCPVCGSVRSIDVDMASSESEPAAYCGSCNVLTFKADEPINRACEGCGSPAGVECDPFCLSTVTDACGDAGGHETDTPAVALQVALDTLTAGLTGWVGGAVVGLGGNTQGVQVDLTGGGQVLVTVEGGGYVVSVCADPAGADPAHDHSADPMFEGVTLAGLVGAVDRLRPAH